LIENLIESKLRNPVRRSRAALLLDEKSAPVGPKLEAGCGGFTCFAHS
jgi:hypothetical protein